jgi:hypothetical protein
MRIKSEKKSMYVWQAFMFVCFIAMLVVYVWHANKDAKHSFSINSLNNEKAKIASEIEHMNLEISVERSLYSVQERAQNLSLVSPQEISFIEIGLSTVAVASDYGQSP